jgi:hypothetical protein
VRPVRHATEIAVADLVPGDRRSVPTVCGGVPAGQVDDDRLDVSPAICSAA